MSLFSLASLAPALPRLTLTPAQMSLILALERVLSQTATENPRHPGLTLICPKCVGSGRADGALSAANHPSDPVWKLDCDCTERRADPATVTPIAGLSELITLAQTVLPSALVEIRCPTRRPECRYRPLILTEHLDALTVSCGCTTLRFSRRQTFQ